MTQSEIREILKCRASALYFIWTYCQIYDATSGTWVPFHLYPEQRDVLDTILNNLLTIILKARQLGMTWLVLAFALWLMLFRPIATVLLFSKRDDEATYLLGVERLKGMYVRLPKFLQARSVEVDNDHEWMLSNGSVARAFPTSAGDSYTATIAIVDESDLVPNLEQLLKAVKPTIDAGGRMILLSRSDKSKPESTFKNIFRAAVDKANGWAWVFLPWWVRPGRDANWYEAQKAHFLSTDGSLDGLYEQYPATAAEALAPASKDKRIPYDWLKGNYDEIKNQDALQDGVPNIEHLFVYRLPDELRSYIIGADPAEGNPTSDDSALEVIDRDTGEQVATLAHKFQPEVFGAHIDSIGKFFNNAAVLVERNNHGHAVLLWLKDNSRLRRIKGMDGKDGWVTTTLGNSILYDNAATAFREGTARLHNFTTFTQLSLVEGATLSAPEGMMDDRADAFALALIGRNRKYTSLGKVTSEDEQQANKWRVDKARTDADEDDEASRWRIG